MWTLYTCNVQLASLKDATDVILKEHFVLSEWKSSLCWWTIKCTNLWAIWCQICSPSWQILWEQHCSWDSWQLADWQLNICYYLTESKLFYLNVRYVNITDTARTCKIHSNQTVVLMSLANTPAIYRWYNNTNISLLHITAHGVNICLHSSWILCFQHRQSTEWHSDSISMDVGG